MEASWKYELFYLSAGGAKCYTSSYKKKKELVKVIKRLKKSGGVFNRPIRPVESWVFDCIRDSLTSNESIKELKILIRDQKGGR